MIACGVREAAAVVWGAAGSEDAEQPARATLVVTSTAKEMIKRAVGQRSGRGTE